MENNKVLILERSEVAMVNSELNKDTKTYKYKGVAADFNDENENGRYYTEEDYLPHLEYLKDQIVSKTLLGECDHGEDYMVSMKHLSHIITDLYYDAEKRQVIIEIELLDTVDGRNMMALADKGIPLHISSRASGYIDDKGNVTLEHIYTYDIVYQPGFANARLERVTESFAGKKTNSKFNIFKISNESLENFNTKILKKMTLNTSNKGNEEKPTFVTEARLNEFTKNMNSNVASLKTLMIQNQNQMKDILAKVNENEKKSPLKPMIKITQKIIPVKKSISIKESLTKLEGFTMGDEQLTALKDTPTKDTMINIDGIDYKIDNIIDLSGVENLPEAEETLRFKYEVSNGDEKRVLYSDVTGAIYMEATDTKPVAEGEGGANEPAPANEQIQKLTDCMLMIEENYNQMVDTVNNQQENLEGAMAYVDMFKKVFEQTIVNLDGMVQFVNALADSHDETSEAVNSLIDNQNEMDTEIQECKKHSDLVAKFVNSLTDNADSLAATINANNAGGNGEGGETKIPAVSQTNENKKTVMKLPVKNISESVSQVLQTVKKQKTDVSEAVFKTKYPFYDFFNDDQKEKFTNLSESKKLKFAEEMKKKRVITEAEMIDIFENVDKINVADKYIEHIPKNLVRAWEALSIDKQVKVIGLFQLRDARTPADIENVWESLDLSGERKTVELRDNKQILENLTDTASSENISELGYDEQWMDSRLGL